MTTEPIYGEEETTGDKPKVVKISSLPAFEYKVENQVGEPELREEDPTHFSGDTASKYMDHLAASRRFDKLGNKHRATEEYNMAAGILEVLDMVWPLKSGSWDRYLYPRVKEIEDQLEKLGLPKNF